MHNIDSILSNNIVINRYPTNPARAKYEHFIYEELKKVRAIKDGQHAADRRSNRRICDLPRISDLKISNITKAEIRINEKGVPVVLTTIRIRYIDYSNSKDTCAIVSFNYGRNNTIEAKLVTSWIMSHKYRKNKSKIKRKKSNRKVVF
jgi:hypothetical protein